MPSTIEREARPDGDTRTPNVIIHVDGHIWRSFSRYLWWSQHPWAGVVPERIADAVGPGKGVSMQSWLLKMVATLSEDLSGQTHYSHICDICQ